MSNENENDPSQSRFAWRPATRADIGSVARFCDVPSPREKWRYGILIDIEQDKFDFDIVWVYVCKHGGDMEGESEDFYFCEIQYDPNQEP